MKRCLAKTFRRADGQREGLLTCSWTAWNSSKLALNCFRDVDISEIQKTSASAHNLITCVKTTAQLFAKERSTGDRASTI